MKIEHIFNNIYLSRWYGLSESLLFIENDVYQKLRLGINKHSHKAVYKENDEDFNGHIAYINNLNYIY
jgi:hypothetical protein